MSTPAPDGHGAEGRPAIGTPVRGPAGEDVGTVSALGLDVTTGGSTWLVITGTAGHRTAVPAYAASLRADGTLVVPFSAALLAGAPAVDSDAPTVAETEGLLRHYGLEA